MDNSPAQPAARVIDKCGGIDATASMLGLHRTVVNRWLRPIEVGGTGGLVPAKHQQPLLDKAREQGKDLGEVDFFIQPAPAVPVRPGAAGSGGGNADVVAASEGA